MTRLSLLLIEDSEEDEQLLLRELTRCGYQVDHKRVDDEDGLRAALAQQDFDVVISDFNLPAFDAREALSVVRQTHPHIPFLIVSGTIREEDAVEAMRAGASDFITKRKFARLAPAVERELRESRIRSERDGVARALRESELRFRQLSENIEAVFWMFSADGEKALYIGPAYRRIWGRDPKPLYDDAASLFSTIHPEERDRVRAAFTEKAAAGAYDERYRILRPDGSMRWIRDRGFPIRDSENRIYRIAGLAEDITEFVETQEALERSQRQLAMAQKMEAVGRLAGGVAHDFNNVLTAITAYTKFVSESLTGKPGFEEALQDLGEVDKAAQTAANLTRQLLAFSRRQVLKPQVIDLNDIVRNMARILKRTLTEDILPVLNLGEGAGCVTADPNQIEQVLLNLSINAKDAMPGGGKLVFETVNADYAEPVEFQSFTIPPGRYVVLSVSDTGSGIAPDDLPNIFEPFFTTKPKGRGTGLGLATVYGIVKQTKGFIAVYSEVGKGTTFRIYLPRAEGEAESAVAARKPQGALRGSETVLLVEDEDGVRGVALRTLEQAGYRVLATRSAEEAKQLFGVFRDKIDLLLTDVIMPGENGRDLAERLKADRKDLKVLFMSGYPGDVIAHHGILDRGLQLLSKPFAPTDLLMRVREIIDGGART